MEVLRQDTDAMPQLDASDELADFFDEWKDSLLKDFEDGVKWIAANQDKWDMMERAYIKEFRNYWAYYHAHNKQFPEGTPGADYNNPEKYEGWLWIKHFAGTLGMPGKNVDSYYHLKNGELDWPRVKNAINRVAEKKYEQIATRVSKLVGPITDVDLKAGYKGSIEGVISGTNGKVQITSVTRQISYDNPTADFYSLKFKKI